MEPNRPELEALVRQILSEILAESAPAPAPAAAPASHPVEVHVHPDGSILVRRGQHLAEAAPALTEVLPASTFGCCIDTCICPTSTARMLETVTLESETEATLTRIMAVEPLSREELLSRLHERVWQRLLHEEAQVFEEEQRGEAVEGPGEAAE